MLQPGEPNCRYHAESTQEDFLVLSGEALLIVDEQERPLKAWDFVHCPGGTRHVFVGAGDGPCVIVMVGSRRPDDDIVYPVSEVALKHGAGVVENSATLSRLLLLQSGGQRAEACRSVRNARGHRAPERALFGVGSYRSTVVNRKLWIDTRA